MLWLARISGGGFLSLLRLEARIQKSGPSSSRTTDLRVIHGLHLIAQGSSIKPL
jgi:hypothetical protein